MRGLLDRAYSRRGRSGQRRKLSSGGGGDPPIYAISGYDSSTCLGTAAGAGPGGASGVGVAVGVFWTVSAVPATLQSLVARLSGNNGLQIRANGPAMQLVVGNGIASVFAPQRTIVADDVGKINFTVLSADGSAAYHYHNAAQVGASTALAGYEPAATTRFTIGSTATGAGACVNFSVLGVFGRNSPISLADVQAIATATKASKRIDLGGVSMAHLWRAPAAPTMPATVEDEIGSDDLSFVLGSEANLILGTVPQVYGW